MTQATFLCLGVLLPAVPAAAAEQINPWPRQVNGVRKVREWTFEDGTAGWTAVHECRVAARGGRLVITSTGGDPYVRLPAEAPGGALVLRLRAACRGGGGGQFFWTTARDGRWSETKSAHFGLEHDGAFRTYEVPLTVAGKLTGLRFDPGTAPGEVEVERLELLVRELHPLEIAGVKAGAREVRVRVRNHGGEPIAFRLGEQTATARAGQTADLAITRRPEEAFEAVNLKVRSEGLRDLERTVFLVHPDADARWAILRAGALALKAAADGSGALLLRGDRPVAAIAPLVHFDGALPGLRLARTDDGLVFSGKGVQVTLAVKDDEAAVSIRSDRPCEGPVLRAAGTLTQGLFAGLEYLGAGERSSSTLDIETHEHLRFAPDPLKVTMPLMACCTDRGVAAMAWKDMSLRPVFASPNFFDGTDDHRMALRGRRIDARLLIRDPGPLEEAILWGARACGLPPLPKPPRDLGGQWDLCLKAIRGPIAGEGGWGHCAEPRWARHPYADVASTVWRLTGTAPELPRLVPGGAHVRNDAIYFVTGRADEWLKMRSSQAAGIRSRQKADGSFRYAGTYRRGHFEDTASGFCARPAHELLEFAWITGDAAAEAAGLKALEYMKRFRTPRGAQTWELSLHTPDVLACAHLVAAYLRGYQLTGREEYLLRARGWALAGVPFVYLWGRYPVMAYATVPVYGATNWRAPNWMGLPVQWCGGVYAYWLAQLAPHDDALDWRRIARGILIAAEQMQYPAGPKVGCLPDVFALAGQARAGPSINPCALVGLRLAVQGEVDSLAVAADASHRVAAPFPVTLRDGTARIGAKAGAAYQVLIDGRRIVDVTSRGTDVIPLEQGGGGE